MSDLLNSKPYTAKHCWHSGGCHYYTITRPDGAVIAVESTQDLTDLLNDAYQKGVEAERARMAKIMAEGDQSGIFQDKEDYKIYLEHAKQLLVATYGFSPEIAERLINFGIHSPAAFEGVEIRDLIDYDLGFTQTEAEDIMRKVSSLKTAQ